MAKKKRKTIKPLTGKFGDFSGIVLKAAAAGYIDAVKHYLKINPDWLNCEGPHGRTLLWEAAYKGRVDLVKELIRRGANVNAVGSYYTPLLVDLSALAVSKFAGRDEVAEILKRHGAKDDFYAACHRGDLNAMKRFVKRRPKLINKPMFDAPYTSRSGGHPIHYAVAGGQIGAIQYLIEQGAKIAEHFPLLLDWSPTSEIKTVLRAAAKTEGYQPPRKKSVRGVKAVDRPDWLGFPPLVDACRGNHNATDDPNRVQLLLSRGANVNIRDHKQKTPLHRACQAGFDKITRLLIENGADLEAEDQDSRTPIFEACYHGRIIPIEILIKNGVNLWHQDRLGKTPLSVAANRDNEEVTTVVLGACWKLAKTEDDLERIKSAFTKAPHRRKILAKELKAYVKKMGLTDLPRKKK